MAKAQKIEVKTDYFSPQYEWSGWLERFVCSHINVVFDKYEDEIVVECLDCNSEDLTEEQQMEYVINELEISYED